MCLRLCFPALFGEAKFSTCGKMSCKVVNVCTYTLSITEYCFDVYFDVVKLACFSYSFICINFTEKGGEKKEEPKSVLKNISS